MNTEIRTTVNLPAELAERVDDYWHNNRLTSRNAAIRELLEAALAAQKPAKIRKSA
jgi:metal-responsive CopG/Arc/MetJ family transcriptional regulator